VKDAMVYSVEAAMMNRVGQQFGNYRLVSFLGQGGFAEVYLGKHVLMGSSAAIKILNAQLISTDSQRFIQEARTLVTLEHPRIVRVKECGIEGGIPFLVMDYAPNGTLRQRHPGRTRVPLELVVSYVSQVADALQYAHDRRFIHRDVKPENMLVGRSGEVLLSDFGIAVMSATSSIRYTKDSAGTAIYMAPEQIERQALPASDQYALGIVTYEWLCGEVPFQGSFGEITAKHLHTLPPPFRQKGVNVPPVVEGIVMKALAKKPEERFPSVKEFALALQQKSPLQMTQSSKRDSWRDDSLILADPGQPSPFTVNPVIPQQPPAPLSTPPLTPSTQPPASSRVTPQAFTSPIQQPIPGLTPNVLPPTMPGQYRNPTIPVQYPIHPVHRSNTGCVVTGIVSAVLVGALVLGLVFFLPKILTQVNGFTGQFQHTTPGISFTQGVTPPPGQTSQGDTAGAVSTINSFCFDISANAIQMAYGLTSTNYRNQHTIDDFNNQFSNVDIGGGGGCLTGNATVSGSNVVIPLTIHYRNGFQTSISHYSATLIQENNAWVIDSIV
jgi:serine/threonine protein kinase